MTEKYGVKKANKINGYNRYNIFSSPGSNLRARSRTLRDPNAIYWCCPTAIMRNEKCMNNIS